MPVPPPPTPAAAPDLRAQRLAQALRANLRRRKGAPADAPPPPRVDDGAPGGERLYPCGPGASEGA